jgi:tail tube protein gp19
MDQPPQPPPKQETPIIKRVYSASTFQLELGDKDTVGFLKSVEGGGFKTEHIVYQGGNGFPISKQLGKTKLEDIKLQVGMAMSEVFYTWIEGFFSGNTVRKHGAIVAADFQYVERARRQFYEALIAEVGFPALDASNKNPCYMNVTLTPERVEYVKGSGKKLDPFVGNMAQKLWTASKFRLEIDGFQDSLTRCHKVDAFTVKQKILESPAGNLRSPLRVPGRIEWPNLTFSIPEVDADPIVDYYYRHAVNGEPQEAPRRTGDLQFLDHEGRELARVWLNGIDFSSVVHEKSEAGADEIKAVKVEIAVESMSFDYGTLDLLE